MQPDYIEIPFNPYELPLKEYTGLIEHLNQQTLNEYKTLYQEITMGLGDCVVLVGSDGKGERHPQSKTEPVIITSRPVATDLSRIFTQKIKTRVPMFHYDLGPNGLIEVKCLSEETPLSNAYGDAGLVYPDRILNCSLVVGNSNTLFDARVRVLGEMTSDELLSRRIRDRMKDQLSTYRQAMRRGFYRGTQIFNEEEAVQYYDEQEPLRFGFKWGMLRAVQRRLDLITIEYVRNGGIFLETLAEKLPVNTADRISFFAEHQMIPSGYGVQELTNAYLWFLRAYHSAQEEFKNTKRTVEKPYNREEYQYYKSIVEAFVGSRS